jgi:hypothetical protein
MSRIGGFHGSAALRMLAASAFALALATGAAQAQVSQA